MEKNGKASSRKHNHHINIRYLFVIDHIQSKEISVKYCPTLETIGEYFTKILQEIILQRLRNIILRTK